jgi:hypothetical protein
LLCILLNIAPLSSQAAKQSKRFLHLSRAQFWQVVYSQSISTKLVAALEFSSQGSSTPTEQTKLLGKFQRLQSKFRTTKATAMIMKSTSNIVIKDGQKFLECKEDELEFLSGHMMEADNKQSASPYPKEEDLGFSAPGTDNPMIGEAEPKNSP